MSEQYGFNTQHDKGIYMEKKIDEFFSKYYNIVRATPDMDVLGIDRLWQNKKTGVRTSVEYKADFSKIGNVFVELVSNSVEGKLGWAYTSLSQLIVYYHVYHGTVLILDTLRIKENIDNLKSEYPSKECKNQDKNGKYTYSSVGLIVPFLDMEKHAKISMRYSNETNTPEKKDAPEKNR